MPLLRVENQRIGGDFRFREGNDGVLMRQKASQGLRQFAAIIVVMVVVKGEFFVFAVVFLVVFVVGIMRLHKIHDANIFLLAGYVVEEMMEKCAHFEEGLHSLIARQTGRQHLKSKEDEHKFFHFRGKGS